MMSVERKRHEPGYGEQALRRRNRRVWTTLGFLAGAGFVVGLGTALLERDDPAGWPGTLPPVWAAIAAGIWLVAIIAGSIAFTRRVDEVERAVNVRAGHIGASFFLTGYPAWYLLWKGGLVPEPRHEILFIATMAVMLLAYFIQKLRA